MVRSWTRSAQNGADVGNDEASTLPCTPAPPMAGASRKLNIVLFSGDETLASFCREVLAETFGAVSKLEVASAGRLVAADDVCLWDFIPGQSVIPKTLDQANWRRCLFLVELKHLTDLEELVGT